MEQWVGEALASPFGGRLKSPLPRQIVQRINCLELSLLKDYKYLGSLRMARDKEFLIDLICERFEFYKESDKDLECEAHKILKDYLEKGAIAPEEIDDVPPQ
jgi:hypothetical protein